MERTLVQFGDVFRFKEKEYVFLAQTDDVLYAGLILDDYFTQQLLKMSDKVETSLRASYKRTSGYYSFVVLKTSEFQNRATWFAKTDNAEHQALRLEVIGSVNTEDRKAIKNEICSKNSSLPLKLIELVRDLNII